MEHVQVERACMDAEPPPQKACSAEPPAAFFCPILCELMDDPVSTMDGQVYERAAIEKWLALHDTSPSTGEVLPAKTLIPAVPLRGIIREFMERQQK